MKKSILTFLFVSLYTFAQAKSDQNTSMQNQIGVLYSLVGDESAIDRPGAKGFQLAFEAIQQSDNTLLKNLQMVLKDVQSLPKITLKEATELSKNPEVFILTGLNDDDLALIAGKAAQREKKIFITAGATSPVLPQEIPNYFFLVAFGDNAQAAAAAQYAYKTLNLKTASILYNKDLAYTRFLTKYFMKSYDDFGGTILSEVNYSTSSLDIDEQLKVIQASQPDLIYLATGPEEAAPLVKKIRLYGLKQPIIGGDSFDSMLLPTEFNDLYYTTHVFLDPESKNPLITQFIKEYKSKFNEPPPNAFAALGYDTCNLLIHAIKQAGSLDTQALLNSLNQIQNFEGVTGTIRYSRQNHVPSKPVTIVSVMNRKKQKVAEFIPENIPPAKGSS